MIRRTVRRALPRLVLVAGFAFSIAGCVSSHGNDGLTFEGRRYVLKVFLDDTQARGMRRVRPYGEASQADPQWVTDRTVYRVADIDPSQIVLVGVDPTRWDASTGSAAPAMAAFSSVDSDLTQPEVSERLAGALPSPPAERLAALAAAEARWQSVESSEYRFTFTSTWLVPPEWRGPFTFFVRDGEAYEAYRGKDPISLEDKTLLEVPRTVPDLFADVRRFTSAHVFDVRFDERLGYPAELKVDVDKDVIDDEGGWLVTDFEVVSAVP